MKDGSVSQCQHAHDVDGIPFCAVDGIINNPNNKAPLPTAKPPPVAKPPVVVKAPEPKKKDKFSDVLS